MPEKDGKLGEKWRLKDTLQPDHNSEQECGHTMRELRVVGEGGWRNREV